MFTAPAGPPRPRKSRICSAVMLSHVRGFWVGRRDAGARGMSPWHTRRWGVQRAPKAADIGEQIARTPRGPRICSAVMRSHVRGFASGFHAPPRASPRPTRGHSHGRAKPESRGHWQACPLLTWGVCDTERTRTWRCPKTQILKAMSAPAGVQRKTRFYLIDCRSLRERCLQFPCQAATKAEPESRSSNSQ